MKTNLRPPLLDEVLRKNTPNVKRRELFINPEGGFFDTRNLAVAIRRAAHGDIILLPPGEYPAFELKKNIEIRSQQPGSVVIRGTVKITSDFCLISGLEFRSEPEKPAILVEKGILVLDDCVVQGCIRAGVPNLKVQLFLRNCMAGNAVEGITLASQAVAEVFTSRITNCHVGVALHEGSSGALYHSRVEDCVGTVESDPGVGIYAERSTVYCEGVSIARSGIGIYLKNCEDARVFSCHFDGSETSALIATDGAAASPLHVRSCIVENQVSSRYAQFAFTGGTAVVSHCTIKSAPAPALTADQTRLEILSSRLASRVEPTIDVRSCHFSGSDFFSESEDTSSLSATSCQGTLRACTFTGIPPLALRDSVQLLFEACELREGPVAKSAFASPAIESPATIEEVLERLKKSVGQESVRNELERILRLAHVGQRRKMEGLPVPEQSFHSIFMGPPGTGKFATAQILARGLFDFGIVSSPKVIDASLGSEAANLLAADNSPNGHGVVFLRAREATSSDTNLASAQQIIGRLINRPDEVVILEGERDDLRRLLRSSPGLERAFRKTLYFANYGPVELAAHFARLCEGDRITISPEAAQALLLALHLYCERRDKRFANTKGVDFLYEAARRRYFERCSMANRFDLALEVRDFEIPQDKALRTALERSPAFVTICPSCSRDNPWVAGQDPQTVCLHCDMSYLTSWGIWKDSGIYRRLREHKSQLDEGGMSVRRTSLPSR